MLIMQFSKNHHSHRKSGFSELALQTYVKNKKNRKLIFLYF